MVKKILASILLSVFLFLTSCSGPAPLESYVRENTNISLIRIIAVLPFEGESGRMRELAITQLLANDIFDVVDKGLVDKFLQQEAIAPGSPLDIFTLRRLGESLGVKAVMLGSVQDVTNSRGTSSYPEITMTLRLIECETGQVLWQASGVGSGYSTADRLFGMAPRDKFQVTMDLLYDLMVTMQETE
jgi:PBP1b-binding outer membrane lipoprotein LpoB